MIANKRGDIPYILGLLFLLSGIVYFFASNWPLLERPEKIGISIILVLFGYAASAFYRRSRQFAYLSNWWLLAAALAFGVSVALIGQIYNSHADSYLLFTIWLIPVLALSILTRYQPFYWLAFLLFELAIWLKLYPTGIWIDYSEWEELGIYTFMMALHTALYWFFQKFEPKKLSYISLFIVQYCAVFLLIKHSIYTIFQEFKMSSLLFLLFHLLYVMFIVLFWKRYMNERKKHPLEMAVHLLFFGVYTMFNSFQLYVMIFGEWIFYTGFLLLIAIFGFSIYVLRRLAKTAKESDQKWARYTYTFFVGVLSFLGTLIGITSLASFVALFVGFGGALDFSYLITGLLCIAVGISLKGEHLAVVRLTLIITGIVFIFFFAFMQQSLWTVWFINFLFAVIAVLLFKKKSALPFYLASNAGAAYGLFITAGELNFPEESIKLLLLLLGAVNILVFRLFKETPMGLLAYLLSISFLFSLTMDVSTSPLWLNILYHLLLMSYLFIHLTRPQSCSRIYRWATWAAVVYFLIWKYYEYVWSLMHKSLAFFIVSAIFFLIFYLWGRNISGRTDQPSWRWKPVLAVLALQLVIIGMTVYQKETILKEGELVALKLEPLDPRSLLQGDYVQLNYTIHNQYSDMYADRDGENGKIQVLLKRTNQSVNYQGKEISIFEAGEFRNGTGKVGVNEDTVSIQGISKYHTLTLGIEHFFIPENTGREWEEMDYALVRVAKNGDAILETLIDIE